MATHIIQCDSPELLPFARSRIKAIRATGLQYASQKFDCSLGQVSVRVEGDQDYISIAGGKPLWVVILLQTTTRTTSGEPHASLPYTVTLTEVTTLKSWVLRTALDFSSDKVAYYGETKETVITTASRVDEITDFNSVQYKTDVLQGAIGAISAGAFFRNKMILLGGGPTSDLITTYDDRRYRDAFGTNWEDGTVDSTSYRQILVGGVSYTGSYGSKSLSHTYVSGTGAASTSSYTDTSSGIFPRHLYHTNHGYAYIAGKIDGIPTGDANAYWKIPFGYTGGVPPVWEAPPDELAEWPHSPLYYQGVATVDEVPDTPVDWGTWIGLTKFMGRPTYGPDRGKLWKVGQYDAVLIDIGNPPPVPPPTGYVDIRSLPTVKKNAELLAALSDDYASGGEFSVTVRTGTGSMPSYADGVKTTLGPTGSIVYSRSVQVQFTLQPPMSTE